MPMKIIEAHTGTCHFLKNDLRHGNPLSTALSRMRPTRGAHAPRGLVTPREGLRSRGI